MNVLLIGGSGFIGTHVAAALIRQGHDVTVFHRGKAPAASGAAEIIGDRSQLSSSADALRALAPDVVIDLILSSGRQARELVTTFRGVASRIVALSSCDVYRACGVLHGSETGPLEPLPLTEDSALRTKLQTYPPDRLRELQQVFGWLDDEYDKISVEGEILGDRDVDGTVLRLPMVYGPGDRLHRNFALVKRMNDRRPAILFSEKQAAWRGPRGYVENVAAAIVLAATTQAAARRVYNVADPDCLSELEWAREIAAAIGWPGEFAVLPEDRTPAHLRQPGSLDQHWVVDTTRIRHELGFAEPIARRDAIARTVEWERANPPPVVADAFDYAAEDAAVSEWRNASAVRTQD